MRQHFRNLRLADSLFHGAIEIEGQELGLARSDQRSNRSQVSLARRQRGTQPDLMVEQVIGVMLEALRHGTNIRADEGDADALVRHRLCERQKFWRDCGQLVSADAALLEDVLEDRNRREGVRPAGRRRRDA